MSETERGQTVTSSNFGVLPADCARHTANLHVTQQRKYFIQFESVHNGLMANLLHYFKTTIFSVFGK